MSQTCGFVAIVGRRGLIDPHEPYSGAENIDYLTATTNHAPPGHGY